MTKSLQGVGRSINQTKLRDRIKHWQSQGLDLDCAKCKAIGQEAQNTMKCGNPCKIDRRLQAKQVVQELKTKLENLNKGGQIEL